MASRAGFTWTDESLFRNVKTLPVKLQRGITAAVEYQASKSESVMRANAPWHDQTGAARSGLHTETKHTAKSHTIIFAHSVPYGIWLEVRFSGRYAIIMPSVESGGRELMTLLGGVLGRMGT
jgi:hypothetical protein